MPNATIPGNVNFPSSFVVPVTSQQAAILGQQAVTAILASMNAGKAIELSPVAPTTVNIAAGSTSLTYIGDNGTAPLTVNDASGGPITIFSGLGGLTYTATNSLATAAANVLIVAGGGPSTINLGFGTATVVADGAATIGAVNGGDTIFATSGGAASINAGAGATVYVAGTDTVTFFGPNAKVLTQNGSNLAIVGRGGPVNGTDSGSVTISAAGAISQFQYNGYGGNVYVDASAKGINTSGNAGGIIINPTNSNVTVFAGAGSETLYGTGDAGGTALNTGNDFVNSGIGFFHGGTGQNILESTSISGAATLIGGSTTSFDALYAQGAYQVLVGGTKTTIMDASGQSGSAASIANFTFKGVAIGAGGDLFNAAFAKQVSIYGAAGGSNTIVSGTGATTAIGNHGVAGASNTYVDGVGKIGLGGGSITISDFVVGTDKFLLNGSTVSSVAAPVAGSSTVTLSDGTKVTLANILVNSANQTSIFS